MCFSSPGVSLEYQEERDKMHGLPACNAIGYAPVIRALVVVLTQRNLEADIFIFSEKRQKSTFWEGERSRKRLSSLNIALI